MRRTFEQAGYVPARSGQVGAFTASVIIPAARSLVTSAALAGVSGSVGYAASMPAGDILCLVASVASIGFLGAWLVGTRGPAAIDAPPGGASRLVLVNPKASASPDRAQRFSEFTNAAERDSSTRRLRGLGYSDGEICEWRDTLIRLGWASWNARDKRGGWRLTSPADDILENMA